MRNPKFNFIPESQVKSQKRETRSFAKYTPMSQMLFVTATNPDIEMYKNRFVRLFLDKEARSVAWQFMEREPLEGDRWRQFRYYEKNGTISLYLSKDITETLGLTRVKGQRLEPMEIGTYRDQSMLGSDRLYYYVTFPKSKLKD